jgi:ketosteroid isomerase-like protein
MGTTTEIIQQVYAAFGRGDIPAVVNFVADEADWEFIGSANLPYTGKRRNKKEVTEFFEAVSRVDEIELFEPREFIEAGEHVTVLGWEKTTVRDTQKKFESEWVHLFTVKNGKITRWRGFFNTAARYGM